VDASIPSSPNRSQYFIWVRIYSDEYAPNNYLTRCPFAASLNMAVNVVSQTQYRHLPYSRQWSLTDWRGVFESPSKPNSQIQCLRTLMPLTVPRRSNRSTLTEVSKLYIVILHTLRQVIHPGLPLRQYTCCNWAGSSQWTKIHSLLSGLQYLLQYHCAVICGTDQPISSSSALSNPTLRRQALLRCLPQCRGVFSRRLIAS
jgi:hypothetical protein